MTELKMMTHVVAGYPTLKKTEEIVLLMSKCGADMIEIQIPFSDPMADGSTIMKANQVALDNGVNVNDCFDLVKRLKQKIETPLLFMTYANIPFRYGLEAFIQKSSEIGIYGLIIPDLTYDEDNGGYLELCKKNNVHAILVISPDMNDIRLKKVLSTSSGFVYTTLKVGITGAQKKINKSAIEYISKVKQFTSLPVAAGFGISSEKVFKEILGVADFGVVGSHFINLLKSDGTKGIERFIDSCQTSF